MAMKRGLAGTSLPGDDQRGLNCSYEFETGTDRTGDFGPWEVLLSKISTPFAPPGLSIMLDDDH